MSGDGGILNEIHVAQMPTHIQMPIHNGIKYAGGLLRGFDGFPNCIPRCLCACVCARV